MEHFDMQRLAIFVAAGSGGVLGCKLLRRRRLGLFFWGQKRFFIFFREAQLSAIRRNRIKAGYGCNLSATDCQADSYSVFRGQGGS
jgi:hypothetical protein